MMKKSTMNLMSGLTVGILLALVAGCSKTTIVIDGGSGGGSNPPTGGSRALVTFHASVEGRNMTRSLTPIAKDISVRLLAYDGNVANASGSPQAEGLYTSSLPGQLSGQAGYKMYLLDGVYNFYGVSENVSFSPPTFSNGLSGQLLNGIDYLWWSGAQQDVTSSQVTIPIVFLHSATQVVFDVAAGNGVTLNELVFAHVSVPPTDAQMELSTGVITPAKSFVPNRPDKMGINAFRAQYIMLPVQTADSMQVYFDVRVNGENAARTFSTKLALPDGALKAGNSYQFEAIIGANDVELSSVDVKDWVDVDETGKPLYPMQN